jgi:hypothetical protein
MVFSLDTKQYLLHGRSTDLETHRGVGRYCTRKNDVHSLESITGKKIAYFMSDILFVAVYSSLPSAPQRHSADTLLAI